MFKHCSLCEDKGFPFTKLIATRQLFREAEDDARITILAPQDPHLVFLKHRHPNQNSINICNKENRSQSQLYRQL